MYEAGPDNCADLLHPARFDRKPIIEPKAYWFKVPTKRVQTYRRLALNHLGAENTISEHTIVRAHDRTAALELRMFFSGNYTKKSFLATESKVSEGNNKTRIKGTLDAQNKVLSKSYLNGTKST